MPAQEIYLAPDYLPGFACKMGACRAACCEGWPISFSMTDYFRLLGVDCSPALRRRLDCAMHLAPHPTPEEYAQIVPRYDGNCPLRLEDGRCALHAELGEDSLSAVCRLYPRGVRTQGGRECSCANSCEAVVELLLRPEPLTFQPTPLTVTPPPEGPRRVQFETAGREQEIRLWLIGRMQDRRYPLPQRLLVLGASLHAMDDALTAHDTDRVARLLSGHEVVDVPMPAEPTAENLRFGLSVMEQMLQIIDEGSRSVRDYGEAVLRVFGQGEEAFRRYVQAREHWEALVPLWPAWMENLMVNHMFFSRFPFQDWPVSLKDEFTALCAVYALLRFLWLGWMADKTDTTAAVDVTAAAFRLIDHTEFDRYAAHILKRLGCGESDSLSRLLCL
ncbi:MAG: flagellin lysine-N-methylase [Aristaeellaceae bacterium]